MPFDKNEYLDMTAGLNIGLNRYQYLVKHERFILRVTMRILLAYCQVTVRLLLGYFQVTDRLLLEYC